MSDPDGAQGTETSAIFAGLQVLFVHFVLTREAFYCPVIRLSDSLPKIGFQKALSSKNSSNWFCFNSHTGTGSDVKAPKKPERPRPSHTVNRGSHVHKHSTNQNESGADSRHSSTVIPTKDGNTQISQVNPDVPTDSQSTNQNGVDVQLNISANTQHTGQNNRDWDAVKNSISSSSHQHRDKDSGLTSPQKHREKRKHCDSADSDKHKRKKRKHSQDARFEGHRISHLVKKRTFKKADGEDSGTGKSDDYVLAKLFKKSGKIFVHKRHHPRFV